MIDRNEEMIIESGDYFVVHYIEEPMTTPKTRNFVFEKSKDDFVSELLTNDNITSIEVGTFLKIK